MSALVLSSQTVLHKHTLEAPAWDNLFRAVDWRWRMAQAYIAEPDRKEVRRSVDAAVMDAVDLQRDLATVQDPFDLYEVLRDYGPLGEAYQIFTISDRHDAPGQTPLGLAMFAAELEGLILAGGSDEEISKDTGITPEAVTAYEATFFDVRNRLDKKLWRSAVVVDPVLEGPADKAAAGIVRAYGEHAKKPALVSAAARGFDPAVAAYDNLYAAVNADVQYAIAAKTQLSVRTVSVKDKAFRSIAEVHQQQLAHDAATGKANGGNDQTAEVIAYLLTDRAKFDYHAPPADAREQLAALPPYQPEVTPPPPEDET